jgi:serine/threonine-protein kinase
VLLGVLVAGILLAATVVRGQKQRKEAAPTPPIAATPAPQIAAIPTPKAQSRSAESPSAPAAQRPEPEVRTRPPARERKPEPTEQAAAGAQGQVTLAILPWGEVYVDGKMHGVSPPLRVLDLKAGRHVIEVRNTSFPVYTEVVDLRPDDRIRVRHDFQ